MIKTADRNGIVIIGIEIGFFDWVGLLVKITLACLPAMLIVGIIYWIVIAAIGGAIFAFHP